MRAFGLRCFIATPQQPLPTSQSERLWSRWSALKSPVAVESGLRLSGPKLSVAVDWP
jgi:hypothetical protein